MAFHHLTETCLAETIGAGGLSDEVLTRMLMAAAPAHDRLCQLVDSGRLPALSAAQATDDLAPWRDLAEDWRGRLDHILVLGTGGSSLGGRALCALAERGEGPRLHFLDSIDPKTMAALLGALDLKRCGLVAISKSGGTAETLAQVAVLLPALELALGAKALADHAVVVTEPNEGPLSQVARRAGLPCFAHDPRIGGRFSVFSVVGALPGLMAGLDVAALRRGGSAVLGATLTAAKVEDAQAAVGAAIAVGLLQEHGVSQSVLMTYEDRLADLGLWYRQLWAESLGKDGAGTTPIRARGTADHHSQLQLYLAGPRDKMFTLVMPAAAGRGPTMDAELSDAVGAEILAGRHLGDLLDASARAAAETLARSGRPLRRLEIARVDEETLGALMMHFMLETILAADLLGVNAFDQPAVEAGKALTRDYMVGKAGSGAS